MVHTKTLFLAKTVTKYPRKHRDLSSNGVLNDAVEALEEFKDVEWPPKERVVDILKIPSWMDGGGGSGGGGDVDGSNDKVANNNNVAPTQKIETIEQQDNIVEGESSSISATSEGGGDDDADNNAKESEQDDDVVQELEKDLKNTNINDEDESAGEQLQNVGEEEEEAPEEKDDNDDNDEEEGPTAASTTTPTTAGDNSIESIGGDEDSTKENGAPQPPPADTIDKRLESIADKEHPLSYPQSPPSSSSNNSKLSSKPQIIKQQQQSAPLLLPVDAAAMEPMHPAVITTLHALCMVIASESKTHKMAEVALECITILTNGRYVSGVAGGRMKLEVQRKMSREFPDGAGEDGQGENNNSKSKSSGIVVGLHNGIQLKGKGGHDGRDGGLSFLGYVVESITRASDSSSEIVQGSMAKALLAIMTCPKCGVHEAAMLQAVRSTFHVYLVGKSVSGKELAKRTLVDMLKCVFMRMEAYDIISKASRNDSNVEQQITSSTSGEESVGTATTAATSNNGGSTSVSGTDDSTTSAAVGTFASQYHTDSYLLFRALCKLSSKTLPGDENVSMVTTPSSSAMMAGMTPTFFSSTPTVDPLALNSKILSLELILAVFEHCGEAFQNGEKFVYAVQSYLCVSLLKNCMSNQTAVAHLSLKIFLLLVSGNLLILGLSFKLSH